MQKKINKISIALSIALVFLGMMGFGQTTLDPTKKSIQAWIYPGDYGLNQPTCNVVNEYSDGRNIDILKPEYLSIGKLSTEGYLLWKEENICPWGCNGFSNANNGSTQNVINNSQNQFVTISGNGAAVTSLLSDPTKKQEFINRLKNFFINTPANPLAPNPHTLANQFVGVELDFEHPTGGWASNNNWINYQTLITTLGSELHAISKKLMIDCPEMSADASGSWDYGFFEDNPNVDFICVMAYDNQTVSSNAPVSPTSWVINIVNYVIGKLGGSSNNDLNMNKIVIGIPSYGYSIENSSIVQRQKSESEIQPNYDISNNPRDAGSNERYFFDQNNKKWYYQDGISLSSKEETIREQCTGIKHISVWSLGGNSWSNKMEDPNFIQASSIDFANTTGWNSADDALGYTNTNNNTCATPVVFNNSEPTLPNNCLIFNVPFQVSSINALSGIEVAIIGHTVADNITRSKSKVEISADNGNTWHSPVVSGNTTHMRIWSHHDVIKIMGSINDKWGISSFPNNSLKVKITYLEGPKPSINGVFVKLHGTPVYQYSIKYPQNGKYVNLGSFSSGSPTVTGLTGGLTYTIAPALHPDFSISNTGNITGISYYALFPTTTYTITATDINGHSASCKYTLITHNGSLFFDYNTYELKVNQSVYEQPSFGNFEVLSPKTATVCPDLPSGLSLLNYGAISGTPNVLSPPKDYTITVTNLLHQQATATINLSVVNIPECNEVATPLIIQGDNGTAVSTWYDYTLPLIHYEVHIPSGVTLKIIGGVHRFTSNSRIIVEKGGKLILDGATLTNECVNMFWQGITVSGNRNTSQIDQTTHGILELKNNATIENAVYGVSTWDGPGSGGGIIRAENANFINNYLSLEIYGYQNFNPSNQSSIYNDFSYVRNCSFIIDNKYFNKPGYDFLAFVSNGSNGMQYTSCKFYNNNTGPFKNKGIGISNSGERLTVNSKCNAQNLLNGTLCPESDIIYSEFKGLDYGISSPANIISNTDYCNIRDSKFIDNLHGIYINFYKNASITRNIFRVKDEIPEYPDYYNYGAYLHYCTRYNFEGNKFEGLNANANVPNYGLVVKSSGSAMNMVYNNEFSNLDFAIQPEDDNRSTSANPDGSGLKIKCNDFVASRQKDISVEIKQQNIANYGISRYQGANILDVKAPAGNTFSEELKEVNSKYPILNNTNYGFFTYYYHSNNATTKYINPDRQTNNTTWNKYPVTGLIYTKQQACPAQVLAPQSPNGLQNYISVAQQQLNSAKLMYTIYKDNGNTQALKNAINLSYPWEAFELYNNLMSKSPSLSDEVLIDAIKREDVLPALLLKYILLANPQAVKSQKVWDALYHRNDPFPDAWIDELKQGAEIVSPLEQLEAQVSYYAQERQQAFTQLKNIYVSDTTGTYTVDSLIAILSTDIEPNSDYELAAIYLEQGNYSEFYNIMDNLPSKYNFKEEEMLIHQDYIDYFDIVMYLIENNMDYKKLTAEHISKLYQLYENDRSRAAAFAIIVLSKIDPEFVYHEPVYLPKDLKMSKPERKANQNENNLLKAFPNPATDYFIVEYNITDAVKGASLEIVDMLNRKLESIAITTAKGQTLIKASAYAKGLYHCYLINNGKIVSQTKITVE